MHTIVGDAVDLAGYYAMIENLDWNIGRLTAGLRDMGVDRDTWIVFFSDHGDCLGSHAQLKKASPWEEALRIPLIVSRVGGNRQMKTGVCDAVVNHVDLAPTTLGLCGLKVPDWMTGHNYAGHCLRDEPRPDPASEPVSAYCQQIPARRMAHCVNRPWRAVVTRDGWKYGCMPGHDWLMFNLSEDPYELANLAFDPAFVDDRQRLHGELASWIERTEDDSAMPDL